VILIPKELEDKLYKLREITNILSFCKSNAIHRSIVLWRLKNDWYVVRSRYNTFHNLSVKDKITLPKEFNI
jgi:hypothetical protein